MDFLRKVKWRKYFLIINIALIVIGTLYCAIITNSDVNIQRITIPENFVRNANYFSSDTPNGSISCLLITPKNDPAPNSLRPGILWLHGWTANKYIHLHYAKELARAGMVVLMTDHPGQGDSGGIHDFGLSEIAGARTALDWLFEVANTTYNLRINKSWIGMTGHSLGGITTANTASIDTRVKAAVSIYTWSNMTETVTDTLGDSPYGGIWLPKILQLTNFYRMVPTIDEANARSPITRVNLTPPRPNNWLLITGENDELTDIRTQCEIMAAACGQKDNKSYIDWIEYSVNGSGNPDRVWEFPEGTMENGTARKLYIPAGLEHGTEGLADGPLYMQMRWFGDAFNWDVETYYFNAGKTNQSLNRWIGFIICFLGLMGLILPVISYLSLWKYDTRAPKSELIPNMPKNKKELMLIIYPIIYVIAAAPALLWVQAFNIEAFIPYLFTDMIILIMAMKLVTLAPAVIGTTYYESKKYNLSLANVGLSRKNALRSIFVGTIAALIFIVTLNVCDYFMVYPLLYPAISPTINIWGFILVLFILLGANFIDELIFRGLAVSKMQTQNKWLVYFVSIGYHSLTAGISTLVIFSLYAGGSLLLLILAFGIGMVLGIINGITNTYIYQRTGNILGGVIFSTLILGFFMCGHFIGLGLITF